MRALHDSIATIFQLSTVLTTLLLTATLSNAIAEEAKVDESEKKEQGAMFDLSFENAPTYIKSDKLQVASDKRTFLYEGNVEVKQGDFTMTSKKMDGTYSENNEIQTLVARDNVFITKGVEITARSERADFENASQTVKLTENPEIQQKGSVLTADLITIFLEEDRSTAEGEVRMKLIQDKEEKDGNNQKKDKGKQGIVSNLRG